MIIDPVSATVAAVQTGMGIYQMFAGDQAKQQEYLNQTAYADASAKFGQWQSRMNAKYTNLNSQYQYWRDTVAHNQGLAHVNQLRNYELAKELTQAQRVFEARSGAKADYVLKAEAITQQLQERGMQEAVAMQQMMYRGLQASAAYQASAQEGATMDRYVANFAKQVGDFNTLQAINQQFQKRQFRREQVAAITDYLNKYNSQQFYEPTEYMDPVAPFPPLPAMVAPAGPRMIGAAPSTNWAMGTASAVMGGVSTYMNTASAIKGLANKTPAPSSPG